jgi:hypothetical protein
MRRAVCFALVVTSAMALPHPAGAGGTGADELNDDEGPVYFGFVRDTSGTGVAYAKVALSSNNLSMVTQTDVLGAFKLALVGADPAATELTCSKDGYQQDGTLRRSPPSDDPKTPVEIDCTLKKKS